MRVFLLLLPIVLIGTAAAAILAMPSDVDHAEMTTPEMLAEYADPPGRGTLDGLRFDTEMWPRGSDDRLVDFMQFDTGLFMSRECTDRCNYPPSAYLTRQTDTGTAFIVEAYCPTKSTTMVWRGSIEGETVSGTVEWTTDRLVWRHTTTLEFIGTLSDVPVDLALN